MTSTMLQAQDLETPLIGAALAGECPVTMLANDVGLRPNHFSQPVYGEAWAAIVSLADRGVSQEPALVISELALPDADPRRTKLYAAMAHAAIPTLAREYAERIITSAGLRHAKHTAAEIVDLAAKGDLTSMSAIAELAESVVPDANAPIRLSIDERMHTLHDHIDPDKVPEAGMSWPWRHIDRLTGGFEPAETTLLGGITGHGKSVVSDMIAEHVRDRVEGSTAGLYLTEMLEKTRDLRAVARAAQIPYQRVRLGNRRGGVQPEEMARYTKAVDLLHRRNIQIEKVGSRTADDIAREIKRRRWTIAVVDLFNALPGNKPSLREQVEHNMKTFAACAQESGTHIICVNHLSPKNRQGTDEYPPEPVLTDFRESSQLGDLANNALMVYLHPEEVEYTDLEGNKRYRKRKSNQAVLKLEKCKEGETGELDLRADFEHMRFLLPPAPGTTSAGSVE